MPPPGPRVCIDCSPLLVRSAGVKTWLYHWTSALREQEGIRISTLFEPPDLGLRLDGGPRVYWGRLAMLEFVRRGLTAGAIERIYPSYYEGFGDAAIYFDPESTDSIHAAIRRAVFRLARARQFDWMRTAEDTLDELAQA
jgi:hypothetical protein